MNNFITHLQAKLLEIDQAGLTKRERFITSQQSGKISVVSALDKKTGKPTAAARPMINLCANNYLGLANHPEIIAAAHKGLDDYGFGMASVRFICGAQTIHRELEYAIAAHLGKDDAILFAACFDANGAVFEPLLEEQDAIISDGLNHASIIDGVRLSKAKRYRFANRDMNELESCLKQADADKIRFKLIVTDGVFSMDGTIAPLPEICDLAEKYGAMIMVDDCHATGHLGAQGRGTPTLTGAGGRVTIITGTFGKTLGGAMGGFIAGPQEIIDLMRQRARPYLFSNSLAPSIVTGSLKALEIAIKADDLRAKLSQLTQKFRSGLQKAGFNLLDGETPIIPVMVGDAKLAQNLAAELDKLGVYVAGFFYPVVPQGRARIRTQMSAALSSEDIDFALEAFTKAGRALKII